MVDERRGGPFDVTVENLGDDQPVVARAALADPAAQPDRSVEEQRLAGGQRSPPGGRGEAVRAGSGEADGQRVLVVCQQMDDQGSGGLQRREQ